MDMEGQQESPRLLEQVRNVMRLHHYSIHTERSHVDWIKRYIHFHEMRCREDLADGERKREGSVHDLACFADSAAPESPPAGEGVSREGPGGGTRGGVSVLRAGAEVSGSRQGLELA